MTARTYPRIFSSFYSTPWAILPAKLDEIEMALQAMLVSRGADGWKAFDDDGPSMPHEPQMKQIGDIAMIPISGTLSPRPSIFSSGGSSTEQIGANLDKARASKSVNRVLLNIDSPGGSVSGVEELGAKIRQTNDVKPVDAVIPYQGASAAYWLASQASSITMGPSAVAGSVGVVYARHDQSEALQKAGVKVDMVSSGKHKTEGNPYVPMTEDERANLQAMSDAYYEKFVNAVAYGRKMSAAHVKATFGTGRMYLAEEAKMLGMVDRIATVEQVIGDLRASSNRSRMAAAAHVSSAVA